MATLTKKPLDWFRVEAQARKHFVEAELRLLGESLKVKQLQPVLAKPDGTLIAGERRYRAARLVGLPALDVIVTEEPLTDTQVKVIQLTENVHRADLTGFEKWRACVELQQINPQWMAKDLADHLNLDPSMVTRLLSPSKCIRPVQEALAAGKLGISDCYAISKLPEDGQAELLALKLSGASRDAIEQAGKKKRTAAPTVRLSRVKCVLPSGVQIVVSGDGISLDEVIESLAEAGKEAKKAREQGLDAKTFQAVLRDKAKAGSG
jgi:ParB/RepB/Spo0J family partition protein